MNKEIALICAELSEAIYSFDTWDRCVKKNYPLAKDKTRKANYLNMRNFEAGCVFVDGTLIVAVRGTEVDSFSDIVSDLKAWPEQLPLLERETGHAGFADGAREVYEGVLSWFDLHDFEDKITRVIVTGHSLGGAIATLLAVRLENWFEQELFVQLYTFGSPKVLSSDAVKVYNKKFINHYRFVNHNDIVPKLLVFSYYAHCGQECYINRDGKLFEPGSYGYWDKLLDGIVGRFTTRKGPMPDGLVDHSISNYVEALINNI